MNTPRAKRHLNALSSFVLSVVAELSAVLGVCYLVAPSAMRAEFSQPWLILAWTAGIGIPLSLFEYLFHRYLLHSAVLPFMAAMHRAHGTHHGLTYVKAPVLPHEPAKLVPVTSEFPVEHEHQEESAMFPLYALLIFFGVFMILLTLPLKLAFPHQPIVASVVFSVALYYSAYEAWHWVLHLPDSFWRPLLEGPKSKAIYRRIYGFHLMHHWRPTSNLAIVGLWGFAVWDYVFRTHRRPERMPLDGNEVNYHDARLDKPLWPISMMDKWQAGCYKASRAVERYLARVFLRSNS